MSTNTEEDYAPLISNPQMLSHIITVYRPSDPTNELIAKKDRQESNELKILRRLNTIQPKFEHVVPLLDSFDSSSSQFPSWAILPKIDTVTDYIELAPRCAAFKRRQRIESWGRKGLATTERQVEGDEEDMKFRKVKKQRLV